MVAAADSAEVIARCTPLEKKGSMKARNDQGFLSATRLEMAPTSRIAHYPIPSPRIRRCRVAEITGTSDPPLFTG